MSDEGLSNEKPPEEVTESHRTPDEVVEDNAGAAIDYTQGAAPEGVPGKVEVDTETKEVRDVED